MIKTTGQKLREEGRAEAFRESLCRLLTARFGKLLPLQQQAIDKAEAATLEAWFERALKAKSLQEILDR